MGTRTRGGDPRITPNTSMDQIRAFCQEDIFSSNPNSTACMHAAMSSSQSEAEALCHQGVLQGCRIAGMPEITAEESARLARNRDEDARREREHTAHKLQNVCDSPACFAIADAVKAGKDIHYVQPWYKQKWVWVAGATAITIGGIVIYNWAST